MTGGQLFLRHAYNCACVRWGNGTMTREDFTRLKSWYENGTEPDVQFLEICFPNAVSALRAHAEKTGQEMWDIGTVTGFWKERILQIAGQVVT